MADQGYHVDLSELEATITELRRIEADLDSPQQTAKYETQLAQGQFGTNFDEASTLHRTHTEMAGAIHKMVQQLQNLVNDFGNKAQKVHGSYSDQEQSTSSDMSKFKS